MVHIVRLEVTTLAVEIVMETPPRLLRSPVGLLVFFQGLPSVLMVMAQVIITVMVITMERAVIHMVQSKTDTQQTV
jgi:hypothetical protein